MKPTQRRLDAHKAVEALCLKYLPIIEEEHQAGSPPQVYLIGEIHTEPSHLDFLADFVEAVRPDTLLSEGHRKVIEPPQGKSSILSEILHLRGFTELKPRIRNLLRTLPSPSEARYERFNQLDDGSEDSASLIDSAKKDMIRGQEQLVPWNDWGDFLDVPLYELPSEAYEAVLQALSKTLAVIAVDVDEPALEPLLQKGVITGVEKALLDRLPDRIGRLTELYMSLKEKHRQWYYDFDIDGTFELFPRSYRGVFRVMDVAGRAGTTIRPFDDPESKRAFIETDDPECYAMRERAMVALLEERLDDELLVTFSGRAHVEDCSPIMKMLERREVPFHLFRLQMEGGEETQAQKRFDYNFIYQ